MAAPSPTAAAAYPKTPDVLFASITGLMPIRLDSSNFIIWRYLMTTNFRAHNLLGYVDGSITPPEKFLLNDAGEPTSAINPSYSTWLAHDAGVQVLIHATLSNTALNHIIGCDTARDLWLKLEESCSSLLNFHVTKYRSELERSTKGSDSVHAYVNRIQEIRDTLTGFDVVIDDSEMIAQAMKGLPTEYNPFRASVAARTEPLTLDGFCVLLLQEEEALRARNQYQFPQFADAQWSSNQCQICNEAGHTALWCPSMEILSYSYLSFAKTVKLLGSFKEKVERDAATRKDPALVYKAINNRRTLFLYASGEPKAEEHQQPIATDRQQYNIPACTKSRLHSLPVLNESREADRERFAQPEFLYPQPPSCLFLHFQASSADQVILWYCWMTIPQSHTAGRRTTKFQTSKHKRLSSLLETPPEQKSCFPVCVELYEKKKKHSPRWNQTCAIS
ncbi:hypothetical protein ACLB2K_044938 [Fragaria x ananassa]